jgi:nucleoid-associated protein YgaU
MQLTYSNGPLPRQPRHPGAGKISRSNRFTAPAILFFSFTILGATVSRAQDQQDQSVAEVARQERARKQEQQKSAKHVYTEEDLKHPNILTPEDRTQIEAKKNECAQKNNCAPAPQNPPAALDANSQTPATSLGPGTSLGEVARQLRKQKELQALKPKQTEPFHLPFSTPALASPILPERSAIHSPAQPVLRPKTSSPKMPSNVFRRDPFSAVPVRPEIPRTEIVRPEIRRSEKSPNVRETVRPEVHADVHTSRRENIRPKASGVRPDVRGDVWPKVREDAVPVPLTVHPDLSKLVRPTIRAHRRLTAPAQPGVSSRLTAPSIFVQPAQPAPPSKPLQPPALSSPAQPVAPGSTVRPLRPQPVLHPPTISIQNVVTVQPGDSLWKLAQKTLGRGNRYTELLAINPSVVNPSQIRAGAQLNLPVVSGIPVSTGIASNSASPTVKVRKGDTLWNLAKSNLGRSSAWTCLAAANPSISDPNRIYEGQNLMLPRACSSSRTVPSSPRAQTSAARP